MPVILAQLSCTLSAVIGVAGKALINTEFLVDTITIGTGNADFVDVTSPTGDVVAHAIVHLQGCSKVEFTFDLTGAAAANALITFI